MTAVSDETGRKHSLRCSNCGQMYRDFAPEEGPACECDRKQVQQLKAALSATPVAQEPVAAAILETLREHHNWHLQAGTIGLQDGDGGWIEIDNGAEYTDSALYERTAKLLEGAPPEEHQPMPRGGMNTWWWEQAVLLRRKVRALEKAAQATTAGFGADEIARAIVGELVRQRDNGSDLIVAIRDDMESLVIRGDVEVLDIANAILALLSRGSGEKRWRHKKRGSIYTEIGRGTLQTPTDGLNDETAVVIYRGNDGNFWVRAVFEFEDGRFEVVPPEAT